MVNVILKHIFSLEINFTEDQMKVFAFCEKGQCKMFSVSVIKCVRISKGTFFSSCQRCQFFLWLLSPPCSFEKMYTQYWLRNTNIAEGVLTILHFTIIAIILPERVESRGVSQYFRNEEQGWIARNITRPY